MKYLNPNVQVKIKQGGDLIVCRQEGYELPLPPEMITDRIPGCNCINCNCNVLISEEKLAIKNDRSIILCYDCFRLVLMDEEYTRKVNFIDINDLENNTLGQAFNEAFGKE